MRLDYWNDPLVVSAFRVRFRGGGPALMSAMYFLALVTLGGILHHYLAANTRVSWVRVYFLVLISIEMGVAALFPLLSTYQSLRLEVTNRTLDYQRIAAVLPRDILLGKLLGEPAQAYLMILSGLPLLIWCYGMGAVHLVVFVLLLVQLVTTALFCGAVGFLQPLEPTADKTKMSGRVVRNALLAIAGIYTIPVATAMPFHSHNPLSQLPLGLLTPVLSIVGVAHEMPEESALQFFSLSFPYLYVTPLSQLAFTALIIHTIGRQLISPVNPPLAKPSAYALSGAAALVFVGAICSPLSNLSDVKARIAAFCLAHLVTSLVLMLTITPGRECLKSWLWRYRGRRSRLADWLIGERTENVGALVVFCLIGLSAIPLIIAAQDVTTGQPIVGWGQAFGATCDVFLTMCLLILSLGTLYQYLVSISAAGSFVFFCTILTLVVVPHIAGNYLGLPILVGASPSGHFVEWILYGYRPLPPMWPMTVLYTAILIAARLLLTQRIRFGAEVVDAKIARMLADQPQPNVAVAAPTATPS